MEINNANVYGGLPSTDPPGNTMWKQFLINQAISLLKNVYQNFEKVLKDNLTLYKYEPTINWSYNKIKQILM